MKIGYPSHPRRPLLDEITWAGTHGFDFVDLFLEPDEGDTDRIDPGAVRETLARHRLGSVGHLAWYLPIGSPLAELRDASVACAVRFFKVFKACGTGIVTVHAAWPPGLFTAAEGIELQVGTLKRLLVEAEDLGLKLMYEPVGHAHETRENLQELFGRFPDLGFHLDIGHFNLNGRNPLEFARAFASRLAHLHLHDNDGSRDQHLPMGAGRIDWATLIPGLKAIYDGAITLEVFSAEQAYLLLTRDLLRRRWDEAG